MVVITDYASIQSLSCFSEFFDFSSPALVQFSNEAFSALPELETMSGGGSHRLPLSRVPVNSSSTGVAAGISFFRVILHVKRRSRCRKFRGLGLL